MRHRESILLLAALLTIAAAPGVHAEPSDRERAQLLQMQQQMQRLQSDLNAAQKERNELKAQAQKAEEDSKKTGKDLARSRAESAAQARDLTGVRADLASTKEQLGQAQAEIERMKGEIARRNETIARAEAQKRRDDSDIALLTSRVRMQTARADLCDTRHAGAMKFAGGLIDRYEENRLRLCEPVTGIWKLRSQEEVQKMREELYSYRLEIPAPKEQAAAEPATDASAKK